MASIDNENQGSKGFISSLLGKVSAKTNILTEYFRRHKEVKVIAERRGMQ